MPKLVMLPICLAIVSGLLVLPLRNAAATSQQEHQKEKAKGWPRDLYEGPGGGMYTGPGGGLYTGPGGGAYNGPGGGLYNGPGGGLYNGPDGGLYNGPGGGLYKGPEGGLYNGPGGGLYTGPGGGLYAGPGGGLYDGPCDHPYRSLQPPPKEFVKYLVENGRRDILQILKDHNWFKLHKLDEPKF